jgi:hypothetical protein
MKSFIAAVLLALTAAASASPFHADAEIDPTAYALSGNSIHVGLGYGRLRLDLGNFAIALPRFFTGNDGFDASFDGWGLKLQLFTSAEDHGLFVGIDGGINRMLIQRGDFAARETQPGVGVQVGYRLMITDHFYATPWIGVGYQFNAGDVTLDGATFKSTPISVYPAVHLGYQFR